MMAVTAQYVDAEKSIIRVLDAGHVRFVPAAPGNRDYDAIVALGISIADYTPPPPTDHDLELEYQRRLFELLGARNMAHAGFIRADNEAELRELLADQIDGARRDELLALSRQVSRLINAYNRFSSPPPADYRSDELWQ